MISNVIVYIAIFFANVENAICGIFRQRIFIGTPKPYKIRSLGIRNGAFNPNTVLLCEPKPEYSSSPNTDITTKLSDMKTGLKIVNESSLLDGRGSFPHISE